MTDFRHSNFTEATYEINVSVVLVTNVSFERTNLFSERSERDHFMD